jgi:hypothetical protein
MNADVPNHEPSLLLMNCGEARQIRPSMGSWVTYGLGSENQNLPRLRRDVPGGYPIQEYAELQSGFLPGVYQGTPTSTPPTRRSASSSSTSRIGSSTKEQTRPARPAHGAEQAP